MPGSTEVITGQTQFHFSEPLHKVFLKGKSSFLFLEVCLSYYQMNQIYPQLTEKAITDKYHSPSYNEQLVEVISSDALRIILAHFHKVIFNCLD